MAAAGGSHSLKETMTMTGEGERSLVLAGGKTLSSKQRSANDDDDDIQNQYEENTADQKCILQVTIMGLSVQNQRNIMLLVRLFRVQKYL